MGVAQAVLDALKTVSNFPSSTSNVAEIAATFCALGCLALIGTVIGTYLGEDDEDEKTD